MTRTAERERRGVGTGGRWRGALVAGVVLLTGAQAVVPADAATATRVSASASRSSVTVGETVRVTGAVSPAQSGRVYLQRYSAGAWRNVASQVLGSSRYAFALKPNATGSWRLRVLKPASGSYAAGASPARTVAVSARPGVTFAFDSPAVDAGSTPGFTWATQRVPQGYSVRLQRQVGTAAAWRDVQALAASGAGKAPAVVQGKHGYRVVVLAPSGEAVAAQVRPLLAYADVELADIIGARTETVQINGQLFRYAAYGVEWGGTRTYLHFDSTSCRRYTLNLGKDGESTASTGTAEVVQETADKLSVRVLPNEVKQVGGVLTGDAADFTLQEEGGDHSFLYVNGIFNCYTADGRR